MWFIDAVVGEVADLVQPVGSGVQHSRCEYGQRYKEGIKGGMRGTIAQKGARKYPRHGRNQRERPGKCPVSAQGTHRALFSGFLGIADKGKKNLESRW